VIKKGIIVRELKKAASGLPSGRQDLIQLNSGVTQT
jgi:hypothetical protein